MLTTSFGPPIVGAGPSDESTTARLHALVALAIRAPSSHNTQPWRFRIDGDAIELHADRSRALPIVDPHDRALVISCGAALGVLRAAIRAEGFIGEIARLPDRREPDLLARVRLGAPHEPTAAELARRDRATSYQPPSVRHP
jgi:nitroreductase